MREFNRHKVWLLMGDFEDRPLGYTQIIGAFYNKAEALTAFEIVDREWLNQGYAIISHMDSGIDDKFVNRIYLNKQNKKACLWIESHLGKR